MGHGFTLRPGENCWRSARADRLAFLVDAESYFRALRRSLPLARESIFVVGWDIDSRLRLVRGEDDVPGPEGLRDFLDDLVKERERLEVRVLVWDYAPIYALERQWLPTWRFAWTTASRFDFVLDAHHPAGASHHEKYVVVDDALAFAGGIDLTKRRWDTCEHLPEDPRRVDPDGHRYGPFHDVQVALSGDAARLLGDLARERWTAATGAAPPASRMDDVSRWPEGLDVDLEGVTIGIARTRGPAGGEGVRESEQARLDAIRAARRWIYVENQYLTATTIAEALEERLREPEGPEVVLVVPERTRGWLERQTMDVLRARFHARLVAADSGGRLRVFAPSRSDLSDETLHVHAKVLVVDDEVAIVGSSNVSNRSMRLDTECDVVVPAGGDTRVRSGLRGLLCRLLAEHLGAEIGDVSRRIETTGSVIDSIEALAGGERTLREFRPEVSETMDRLVPEEAIFDPERPIAVTRFLEEEGDEPARAGFSGRTAVTILVAILAVAAAWRFTPLSDWIDPARIESWLETARESRWSLPCTLAVYVAASLAVFPVTVLIAATGAVFGPWVGFVYAISGSIVGALAHFAIGRTLGDRALAWIGEERRDRIGRWLRKRGVVTLAAIRLIPIAPFAVVNVVAGATRIRWRDFVLATALGMAPGIAGITWLSDRVVTLLRDPSWNALALFATVAAVFAIAMYGAGRWAFRRGDGSGS